jgi:Protein of unknown function (DUF2946)
MFRRLIFRQPKMMLALIALTLALRVIVPSGFMPTTGSDGMIRISMCSGMGPQTAWLDKSGRIHKDTPAKGQHDPQPCGFGALALGAVTPSVLAVEPPILPSDIAVFPQSFAVAVGRGLAAPPPPSTGPPILI